MLNFKPGLRRNVNWLLHCNLNASWRWPRSRALSIKWSSWGLRTRGCRRSCSMTKGHLSKSKRKPSSMKAIVRSSSHLQASWKCLMPSPTRSTSFSFHCRLLMPTQRKRLLIFDRILATQLPTCATSAVTVVLGCQKASGSSDKCAMRGLRKNSSNSSIGYLWVRCISKHKSRWVRVNAPNIIPK